MTESDDDTKSNNSDAYIGIIGVILASICWGSNFMVCKGYDNIPSNGLHFAFCMALGILLVGFVTLFFAPNQDGDFVIVLAPLGLAGGAIWACGNALTVSIIWHLGLGVGISTWMGFNIIVAFIVGALGMEGIGLNLPAEDLTHPVYGVFGVLVAIGGLFTLAMVQSGRSSPKQETTAEENDAQQMEIVPVDGPSRQEETSADDTRDMTKNLVVVPGNPNRNTIFGFMLAAIAGFLFGFQFVPLSMWNTKVIDNGHIFGEEVTSDTARSVRFFFSQFAGIFLMTCVVFFGYAATARDRIKLVPPEATVPAILSGVVWAIGCAGAMFATSGLGNAVGFPLTLNGTFLVNSSWSVFYFREIQGWQNLSLYAAAFALSVTSSILISLSKA